jgi:hypothetical protein
MNEKLQEAISLYNKGDKSQASNLLIEIVRQEPNNSVAWYGLALCLDDPDKKVFCLKRVLSLDPSHIKARHILEKLQVNEKSQPDEKPQPIENSPSPQKITEPRSFPTKKKESSVNWVVVSILGTVGILLIGVIVGVTLTGGMSVFKPTPTPIPPTRTPIPSPTPSIFTGEPTDYFPNLPSRYHIDPTTLRDSYSPDGVRIYSVVFNNSDATYQGELVSGVYYINLFPSIAKAMSGYNKILDNMKADGGTIDENVILDGATASAMYLKGESDATLSGRAVSRVKNIVIVTDGLTQYDSQDVTTEFLKGFMTQILEIQKVGIRKLSGK